MNKKLLITIGIILGLAIVAGGFWYVQRYVQDDSQEVVNSEQENIEVIENEDQNNKQENQSNNPSKNQISTKQLTKEEIEKLKKEKDLVWYKIPEMGIKFLVEKEIANKIGYRDFYVESFKANGKELYIVDYYKHYHDNSKNLDSFAELIPSHLIYGGKYVEGDLDRKVRPQEACRGDNVIIYQDKYRMICYHPDSFIIEINKKNGNYDIFDNITKKLFDGYLKTVPIEIIK